MKTRPFLKWAGNKYRCLNDILPHFPKAKRLIEPFTGSASIFMNSDFSRYLLAEQNQDLIMVFHHLKQEGEAFIQYCQQFFIPENNCATMYYHFRKEFNQTADLRLKAALFLYLNRHGYNGLCRYNQGGGYNVPFGSYSKPYFPQHEMLSFYKKSRKATFIQRDFRQTFTMAKPGDIVYCDPPYVPIEQQTNFSSYTSTQFGEEEQIILTQLAIETAHKGIPVLISNHDTPFTRYLYQQGNILSFPVRRSISRKVKNRGFVNELLVIFR